MHKVFGSSAIAFSLVALVGCGGGPSTPADRAAVSGTVVFNGTPLPAGTIGFQAADGVTNSSAKISDGKYTTDRAPLGDVTVTVSTKSVAAGNPAAYVAIPERYESPATSGFKATITASGATDLNFELKD